MNTLIQNKQASVESPLSQEFEQANQAARFAIFLPSFRGGGAERAMILLAEEFCRRQYMVDMIVVSSEGPLAKAVPDAVRVIELNKGRTAAALPALMNYLRRERPRALYTTMAHSNVVALLAGKLAGNSTPIIVREANVPLSSGQTEKQGLAQALLRRLISLTYNWAEAVVSVSNDVATELLQISPALEGKISVLPTPVISRTIFELSNEPFDHPWYSEGAPPVILGAGRLHPQKDFRSLLHAFSLLKHDARLVILGEGAERENLLRLANLLGIKDRVDFPGYIDNPFNYMKRAALFVLSSRYEGMPNVLIQAMALGTPVISTDCPGGSRDVLLNGRLGQLVPPGNSKALARAIDKALSQPPSPEAAAYVNQHYQVQSAATAYLNLLNR